MSATLAYAEHGGSTLSRESRRIWADDPDPEPVPWPQPLTGKRCGRCHYRTDALGHARNCGES